MDTEAYIDIMDVYCISNGDISKEDNTTTNGVNRVTTYDDVINNKHSEELPNWNKQNEKDFKRIYSISHGKECGNNKKRCILCLLIILAMLTGLAVVLCYILNPSQGISSSYNYPVLNPDLCNPVNPYYDSSWFTPSPTDNFFCDVPVPITAIFIEEVKIYNVKDCLSKLDCIIVIGLYFLSKSKNAVYNFFIDNNGNVYGGRGWMCPYVSGQLWIGIMMENFNSEESEEMKRILKHFNNEIMNYGIECGFLNIELNITYKIT